MGNERADRELDIFRQFAVAAGLSDSLACGEKRTPPEPDILFRDTAGAYTAFELVELLDQEYGNRVGLLVGTKTALRTYYEGLPEPQRSEFQKKYGNALLYFQFPDALTFKRRRAAFPGIFDRLLRLPNGFTGEAFEDEPELQSILNGVSISRGRFIGPIFDPESVGWVGDPTVPAIQKKFAKQYQTEHPIELLAYIEINPMFPDEVWIADLQDFLARHGTFMPFRRIWVFHVSKKQVKCRYPA